MADLDVLRQLIDDDALVFPENDPHGRNVISLVEESEDGPPYAVVIHNVPDEVVVVRADRFPVPAFKNTRGERKRGISSWWRIPPGGTGSCTSR